ncbi:IucA/IucC family protein [Sphaerisporangium corydalis]|uniref:IucA/IucC family protein n=1 Tax=Sphaerisporangium corydalis TaxID=1441875 RepID=A0ABV9EGV2_9ACTN|nr:IucA/IucC family protein [Sphaerisporangium corydalis]
MTRASVECPGWAVGTAPGPGGRGPAEPYLAARVLDALLREDYGGLAARMTRTKDGVLLVLPSGRRVRLAPGHLYQDFVVADGEALRLREVLDALVAQAAPADADGVAAFAGECRAALRAYDLHDRHREHVLTRLRRPGPRETIVYEALGAFGDHPVYPTSRARIGLSDEEVAAYAPEFAPSFPLRWAEVDADLVTRSGDLPDWWPSSDSAHALFPVHPLTLPAVREIPGVTVRDEPHLVVRPTLSMRTVEVGARTHLKLPLATSTLGARNRRSIRPGTLGDGARAERLLREVLAREPDLDVVLADEQTYAHAGHEYLGWMVRHLPPGEIIPIAALLAPSPGVRTENGLLAPSLGVRVVDDLSQDPRTVDGLLAPSPGDRVVDDLAARYRGGSVAALLAGYLRLLFTWNVRLFVTYGVALEAHQQNLALVFGDQGTMRLLVKDNDGLLASPDRLVAAGLAVPEFADRRLLTGDPHALADVFVTITLHLAAAAIAFGAGHGELVAEALAQALAEHGGHPMARLLRARTLDAARLVGKSMVSAGTLVERARIGAADINKHYGTSGPNYLRRHPRREATP